MSQDSERLVLRACVGDSFKRNELRVDFFPDLLVLRSAMV
jgi:hypothetical protein